jgi:hypothetical protein
MGYAQLEKLIRGGKMIKNQIVLPYKAFGIVWRNTSTYFIVGFAFGKSVFGLVFWKNIND